MSQLNFKTFLMSMCMSSTMSKLYFNFPFQLGIVLLLSLFYGAISLVAVLENSTVILIVLTSRRMQVKSFWFYNLLQHLITLLQSDSFVRRLIDTRVHQDEDWTIKGRRNWQNFAKRGKEKINSLHCLRFINNRFSKLEKFECPVKWINRLSWPVYVANRGISAYHH